MVILFSLNVHTTFKIIICKVIIFFWLSVILYNRHLIYLINHKLMLLVCSLYSESSYDLVLNFWSISAAMHMRSYGHVLKNSALKSTRFMSNYGRILHPWFSISCSITHVVFIFLKIPPKCYCLYYSIAIKLNFFPSYYYTY